LLYLAQDLNEQTSLYLAVLGGHVDVVEYLLSFRLHGLTQPEIELFKRRPAYSYSSSENNHPLSIEQYRLRSSTYTVTTLSEFNATLHKANSSFCPFNLDIYSNTGRTAIHEAVEQENFKLVHLLVSNGANVNLPYEEITSRSTNEDQCYVKRSTALSCACRLGNIQLIEYLLNSLATDKDFLAYNSCKQVYLIGHLLKYRALQDKEFKLIKRQLTSNALYPFDEQFWSGIDLTKIWINMTDEKKDDNNNNISESNYSTEPVLKRRSSKRYQILTTSFEQIKNRFTTRSGLTTNLIPSSSPIPSIPVGIQWHHYGPLKTLHPLWFIQASIFVNKDTFTQLSDITISNRHLLLHCITRIDLSDNSLECLPTFLFQMYSLRILNVSNNQLGELPNDNSIWLCHQLIELDVSHNALTFLPASMFQLRSLQRAYAGKLRNIRDKISRPFLDSESVH
jgi:ankyrin repeat protein